MNASSCCTECGENLARVQRRMDERIWCREAYRCLGCGAVYRVTRLPRFRDARWAKCPKCSFEGIKALKRIDPVDRKRGGFFNLFHRILGGRLYHCWHCRLQFYDFRPRRWQSHRSADDDFTEFEV